MKTTISYLPEMFENPAQLCKQVISEIPIKLIPHHFPQTLPLSHLSLV